MKLIADLHTHTVASGHAYSTLMENLQSAAARGLDFLGSSDHAPGMDHTTDLSFFYNLKVLPIREKGVRLLRGTELNVLDGDGQIDLPDELLSRLDYAITSLHVPIFEPGDAEYNTLALLKSAAHPKVKIIGHPEDSRYPKDFDLLAREAALRGKALELNNASLTPFSFRQNGKENALKMLAACRRYQAPIVVNSDCHICCDIGECGYAMALLLETDFPEELILNASAERLTDFLKITP